MHPLKHVALSVLVALVFVSTARAGVQVSLHDGRVSIVARDATLAEILSEWAKVGQVTVVNLELIPRDRVTLELTDVTEEQALAVLLRKVSGYLAARRVVFLPDASRFERLNVMPFAAPVRSSANVEPVSPDAGSPPPDAQAGDQTRPEQGSVPLAPANPPADRPARAHVPASQAPALPDQPPLYLQPVGQPAPAIELPTIDPRAQAAIKARQSVEVADPRQFQFKVQPPPPQPGQPVIK